jgi:uncharacterized protein YdaT
MSGRTRYHVTHDPDGGWKVKITGAKRPSSKHDTRSEAIERARELAKDNKPAQVIVHRRNRTIETEFTYERDPYPPPG